jgi:hypothetical protein
VYKIGHSGLCVKFHRFEVSKSPTYFTTLILPDGVSKGYRGDTKYRTF